MINATVLGRDLEAKWEPFGGQTSKGQPDSYDDALAGTIMTCTAGNPSNLEPSIL